MKHLNNALEKITQKNKVIKISNFIKIKNNKIEFTIQNEPIKKVGINGIQASDILDFCFYLFNSLNNDFYCEENINTLSHILEALEFQKNRTKNREKRGVEGQNKL